LGALADNSLSAHGEVLSSPEDSDLYENDKNTSRTQSVPFNRQATLPDLLVGVETHPSRRCGKFNEKRR
jgi:hypothetical protein